jgi:hypothetical protein
MLARSRGGFAASKGDATAVLVQGNADGSLKVTQSPVLTASGLRPAWG